MTAGKKAAEELQRASTTFSAAHGEQVLNDFDKAANLLLEWLKHLANGYATRDASPLLAAAISAAREAAGCLSLGLVRPAIFAMRSQYDLVFAWLYLHTHPMEWQRARNTGDGYPLRGEVYKYIKGVMPGALERLEVLEKRRTPAYDDPYDILSIHVHCKTELALPAVPAIKDIVSTKATVAEAITLQRQISGHLSDVLLAYFIKDWPGLPLAVRKDAEARLQPAVLTKLRS